MVRHAPRSVSDALARGRPPSFAAKLLLRSAGPFERAGGAGALELVGIAAVLYLRLRPTPLAKSYFGSRYLCGDLPGSQCTPGFSRKCRRLCRAVRIVGRDVSRGSDHLYLHA